MEEWIKQVILSRDPADKYGLPIISGIIGYVTDDDPNRWRAAGTAGTETFMDVGIPSTGVGSAVLLGNAGVQLYGSVVEASTKLGGRLYGGDWEEVFYQQAYSLDDNFDRIDLGNTTHDLAHVVVDSLRVDAAAAKSVFEVATGKSTWAQEAADLSGITSELGQDYKDLWEHVSSLPGGLIDTTIDIHATGIGLSTVASFDKGVSSLPVPNDWKNSVHEASLSIGQQLADFDLTGN